MKVLVVHNRYRSATPSGENAQVDAEVELLASSGFEVLTFFQESDALANAGIFDMAQAAMGPIVHPSGVHSFMDVLRRFQPQIVHFHNVFPLISPAAIRCAARAGAATVHTVHNYRHSCLNGLHFRNDAVCTLCATRRLPIPAIVNKCYRQSRLQSAAMAAGSVVHERTWHSLDAIIALTPFMADRLQRGRLPSDRIKVRHSWVADTGFHEVAGRDILFLGRLDENKGVELLLDAWAMRRGTSAQTRLTIAGVGALESVVRARAAADPSLDFVGRLDRLQVAETLAQHAVVALPSLWFEGLPLSALEAMAQARPVILNAGGSPASALPKAASWQLSPTAANWAECIDSLSESDIRHRSGAARQWYEREASPAYAIMTLTQIYKEALERHASRRT